MAPGWWIQLPDGDHGWLAEADVPPNRRRLVVGDGVRVVRDGAVEKKGRPSIRLRWAGSTAISAPPAVGAVFDDAVFEREVPGLAILRFDGRRQRGAAPLAQFRAVQRSRPEARAFRVRVERLGAKGYRLTVLDSRGTT